LEGTVSDPEYYLDHCCTSHLSAGVSLPPCKIITGAYNGNGKSLTEQQMSIYPGATFIPVGPKEGICGELTITYSVPSLNCCEGVDPLSWNTVISAQAIDRSSSAWVAVKGSSSNLEKDWTIYGNGFWLDPYHTKKQRTTTSSIILIYTDNKACGSAVISATDGCSTASGIVKCTYGIWRLICDSQEVGLPACPAVMGPFVDYEVVIAPGVIEGFKDNLRMRESVACIGSSPGYACGNADGDKCCEIYGEYPYRPEWPPGLASLVAWMETPAGEWCSVATCEAMINHRCGTCDDLGGMHQPSGIYAWVFPHKKGVTRRIVWEWVCE
jgi:hypothetical protein